MPLKLAFLDPHAGYDARDFMNGSVSGTESCTILIAEALARRGHQVTVCNKRTSSFEINGVRYLPLGDAAGLNADSIAISNNSISVLRTTPARHRVVWAHLDLRLRRLLNKGDLLETFRVRPHLVVPSRYSARRTQAVVPFRSRRVIEHGVDAAFLDPTVSSNAPAPIAVFASQPGRNLNLVMQAWREQVRPRLPAARLYVYCPKPDQIPGLAGAEADGIEVKGSLGKAQLAQAFRRARVMIYPGHKEETFCNAAAEAIACGLPVVTMGIGALAERVRHDIDGFVAPDVAGMGEHALQVLVDDALWARLHCAGVEVSQTRGWDVRAAEWEAAATGWR